MLTKPGRQTLLADNGLAEFGSTDHTVILALVVELVVVDRGLLVLVKEAVGLLEVPGVTDPLQSTPQLAILLVWKCVSISIISLIFIFSF